MAHPTSPDSQSGKHKKKKKEPQSQPKKIGSMKSTSKKKIGPMKSGY